MASEIIDKLAGFLSDVNDAISGETKEYSEGDLVRMKSGGPEMVVTESYRGSVKCRWMNSLGEPQSARFSNDEIEQA
jgi:uncharacterized protein YodC (DUF2158 family)